MADLALLVLTLAWGTTFLLVKNALAGTSAAVFLVLRFALGSAAVALVVLARRDRLSRATLRHGALLGAAMFAGYAFQTFGLKWTTPARSGFLTGLAVLIVPFLSRFLFGRRVPLSSWAGALLAVVGLVGLTEVLQGGLSAEVKLGDLLTVGCALACAVQIVYTSEWSGRHPLAPLVLVQVATTLALSALLLAVERPALAPTPALWATVLYVGLGMTAGAAFLMNWGQRHTTAVRAALIYSLEPVVAALFSHFVGGEPIHPGQWAGGALIVAGIVLGEVGAVVEARVRAPAQAEVAAAHDPSP